MTMWITLSSLCLIVSVSDAGIYSGLDEDKQANRFIGRRDFGREDENPGVKTILIAVPVVSGGVVSGSGRKGSYFDGVGSLNEGGTGFTVGFAGNLGKESFGGGFGAGQEKGGFGGGLTGSQTRGGLGSGFSGSLGKGNFAGGFRGKFDAIGFGKASFNQGLDRGVGKVDFNGGFGARSLGIAGTDKEDFVGRNAETVRKGGLGSTIENGKGRLIDIYGSEGYNSGRYENIGEGIKGDFTFGGPRTVSFFRKGFLSGLKADAGKRSSKGGFGEEECDFPEVTKGDFGKDGGEAGFAKNGFLGGVQKFGKDNGKGISRNGRDSDVFQRQIQNNFGEERHDGNLNRFVSANEKGIFSKVANGKDSPSVELGGENGNTRLGINVIKLGEISAVGEGYIGHRNPSTESFKGGYDLKGVGQFGSSSGFSRSGYDSESPFEFQRNNFGVDGTNKREYRQTAYGGVKGRK